MENNRITAPVPIDSHQMEKMLCALRESYPFLHCAAAGKSLCARPLRLISLGTGAERVLFAGAFHGEEWISSFVLLRFLERVCEELTGSGAETGQSIAGLLRSRQLVFLPMVNPDGVEIALNGPGTAGIYEKQVRSLCGGSTEGWNANARGIDLNHNFNAGFPELRELERANGITGPAKRRFGGTVPHSEPETAAVVKLCERIRPIRAAAFHAQGEEIFWRYGTHQPPGAQQLASMLAKASGYTLRDNAGLSAHGGFKDWFIAHYRLPAFTFELGRGVNPLPLRCFEEVYAKVERALFVLAFS